MKMNLSLGFLRAKNDGLRKSIFVRPHCLRRPAFLLIELGVALVLIGLVVTIISMGVAHGVGVRRESALRLLALDYARDVVECLYLGQHYEKKRGVFVVTVRAIDDCIDQKTIDEIIPRVADAQEHKVLRPSLVSVAWQGVNGGQKQVSLVAMSKQAREVL